VPLEHLRDVGRVSPGDVVFSARSKLTPYGQDVNTQMRLVGLDFLNKQLGGRPEYDGEKSVMNWQVGYNVMIGGPNLSAGESDQRYNAIADEWRGLTVFQEWTCDGVVLSNDQPGGHNSSGERDGQLFNIAIQGVCPVNNGYGKYANPFNPLPHTQRFPNSSICVSLPCLQSTSRAVASSPTAAE